MEQDTRNLIIARLNSVAVSVEDLILASHVVQNLPPEQRGWTAQTTCVTRLFNGQRSKAFAVHYRLQALAALITSGKLPQFLATEMDDGGRMVAEPVFFATAKEPIFFTEKGPLFHPESFLEAVLRHGGVEGYA